MYKPDGNIIVDGNEAGETRQCPHCGMHFLSVRGSGKKRGYCMCCGKVTCGKERCDRCYPTEKMLEDIERHGNKIPISCIS